MDPIISLTFAGVALLVIIIVIFVIIKILRTDKKVPKKKPAPSPATTEVPPKFIGSDEKDETPPPVLRPLKFETPLPAGDDQNKIRILVVDDNVDTTDNVSRLIYFEEDMKVIGQAYNGREGLEMTMRLKPHIVLMDINMPDMDGITATKAMQKKVPFSQVIIMSVQADPQYMKQAMVAGARDFQPKPFTADELVSCIRRVYKIGIPFYQSVTADEAAKVRASQSSPAEIKQDAPKNAAVIVFFSPKGGIGTSTLAVNFALALQKSKVDTILFDADLQFGDIPIHLNLQVDRGINDLIDIDEIEPDVVSQVLIRHHSGLRTLAPPPAPERAELISPKLLTDIIGGLKNNCEVLIIDTGSVINDQMLTIFDNTDAIMLVTSPELTALKSARFFVNILHDLGFPHKNIYLLINRADMQGAIPSDEIKRIIKTQFAFNLPNHPQMTFITNKGELIVEKYSDTPIARAINHISAKVWANISVENKNKTP